MEITPIQKPSSMIVENTYSIPPSEKTTSSQPSQNGQNKTNYPQKRRPRSRSIVLVRARKILIMEFQQMSFQRPQEYGQAGDEVWIQKLYEHMHSSDREVKLEDVKRWIRGHNWIVNPHTSPPPFTDFDYYGTRAIFDGTEPIPSTQTSTTTTHSNIRTSASTVSTSTFTNSQANGNNFHLSTISYPSSYNFSTMSSSPANDNRLQQSTSSANTRYDCNSSEEEVIAEIHHQAIPYGFTSSAGPSTQKSSRTSINTPVPFSSYEDVSTEINYSTIPSFATAISPSPLAIDETAMTTSTVASPTYASSQLELSFEEKDTKYGHAFCAVSELYNICQSIADLNPCLLPIQNIHETLTRSYSNFTELMSNRPQQRQQ